MMIQCFCSDVEFILVYHTEKPVNHLVQTCRRRPVSEKLGWDEKCKLEFEDSMNPIY